MVRKSASGLRLPEGLVERIDRYIKDNPGLGFESREEVVKVALREFLASGGDFEGRVTEKRAVTPLDNSKAFESRGSELKASPDKLRKLVVEILAYDSVWAEGLNKDLERVRGLNPAAYDGVYCRAIGGDQRIIIKNVDQWDILDKVLANNLSMDEIKKLRDFLKNYAQNYDKMKSFVGQASASV